MMFFFVFKQSYFWLVWDGEDDTVVFFVSFWFSIAVPGLPIPKKGRANIIRFVSFWVFTLDSPRTTEYLLSTGGTNFLKTFTRLNIYNNVQFIKHNENNIRRF